MVHQTILAAGSMLGLLPKLLGNYFGATPSAITTSFGPSGALRSKIEAGHACALFISATSVHTDALVEKQILKTSNILGLNSTVLLHQKSLNVSEESAVHRILDPNLALGMSTTGLDPSADDLEILRKISANSGVDTQSLRSRIRIITGGRETPNSPQGRNQYGWIMETQDVDLLLTFQSNAIEATDDNPQLQFCNLPEKVRVDGYYGIGISPNADQELVGFYNWLLSDVGQGYLRHNGFEAITNSRSGG